MAKSDETKSKTSDEAARERDEDVEQGQVDDTTRESMDNARRNAGIPVTSGDLEQDADQS